MRRWIALFVVCGAITGCVSPGESDFTLTRQQSVTPPPQLSGTDVGADRYADAAPTFAGVDEAPRIPSTDNATDEQARASGTVGALLQAQGQAINCGYLGELAVEYSELGAQQDGSASIEMILDTRILDDWSGTAVVPTGEEKIPVIRCWARVRWSIGVESDVDLWLLVDSDANVRVRWDNITNVEEL